MAEVSRKRPAQEESMDNVVDGEVDGPEAPGQSGVFLLKCNDFFADRKADDDLLEDWQEKAAKMAAFLESASFPLKTSYKDIAGCVKKCQGVKFPFNADFIPKTSSTVEGFRWIPPVPDTVHIVPQKLRDGESYFVNMHITLPKKLLGPRDYQDFVYETKRALYLSVIASLLKKQFTDLNVDWVVDFHGEHLPFLRFTSKQDENLGIRIYCAADLEKWINMESYPLFSGSILPTLVADKSKPTPLLTQRQLSHFYLQKIDVYVNEKLEKDDYLQQPLSLIQAWHSARRTPGFHPYLPALLLIHVMEKMNLLLTPDCMGIINHYFNFWVKWSDQELKINQGGGSEKPSEQTLAQMHEFFEVIVMNGPRWNMAANMKLRDLSKLKCDVAKSQPLLGDHFAFDELFIGEQNFENSFDYYICIPVPLVRLYSPEYQNDVYSDADRMNLFAHKVLSLIEKALTDRAEYCGFSFRTDAEKKWSVDTVAVTEPASKGVTFAFRSGAHWSNPLTIGPVANLPEAQTFRQFWCSKTQLRRFADNTIRETMVWSEQHDSEVPAQIVDFVIKEKFKMDVNVYFRNYLRPSLVCFQNAYTDISKSLARLSGMLRNLDKLPLQVTGVTGMSPYCRGTEPNEKLAYVPEPYGQLEKELGLRMPTVEQVPRRFATLDVYITLTYAWSQWGEDPESVHHLIVSFYILMGEMLNKIHNLACHPTTEGLYVLLDKKVFRIVIVNHRLIEMYKTKVFELHNIHEVARVETTETGKMYNKLLLEFQKEPAIRRSLNSYSVKHTFFRDTCHLFKRWLASRLFSNCLNELVIEMLVVAAFETHSSLGEPRSAVAGFRRVLHLVATHNWVAKPLVVPVFEELTAKAREDMEKNFVNMRAALPPMVICTKEDPIGNCFTNSGPSPVILKRLVALARSSVKTIDRCLCDPDFADVTVLFTTYKPTGFDAKIVLREDVAPVERKKRMGGVAAFDLPVMNFDVIEMFIQRLENEYSRIAMFFYDKYAGAEIYLKWRDNDKYPARISRCGGYRILPGGKEMEINRQEIFEGIAIIGEELVERIEVGGNVVIDGVLTVPLREMEPGVVLAKHDMSGAMARVVRNKVKGGGKAEEEAISLEERMKAEKNVEQENKEEQGDEEEEEEQFLVDDADVSNGVEEHEVESSKLDVGEPVGENDRANALLQMLKKQLGGRLVLDEDDDSEEDEGDEEDKEMDEDEEESDDEELESESDEEEDKEEEKKPMVTKPTKPVQVQKAAAPRSVKTVMKNLIIDDYDSYDSDSDLGPTPDIMSLLPEVEMKKKLEKMRQKRREEGREDEEEEDDSEDEDDYDDSDNDDFIRIGGRFDDDEDEDEDEEEDSEDDEEETKKAPVDVYQEIMSGKSGKKSAFADALKKAREAAKMIVNNDDKEVGEDNDSDSEGEEDEEVSVEGSDSEGDDEEDSDEDEEDSDMDEDEEEEDLVPPPPKKKGKQLHNPIQTKQATRSAPVPAAKGGKAAKEQGKQQQKMAPKQQPKKQKEVAAEPQLKKVKNQPFLI